MVRLIVRHLIVLHVLGLNAITAAGPVDAPAQLGAANPEKNPGRASDPFSTRLVNELKKKSVFETTRVARALAQLGEVEAAKAIIAVPPKSIFTIEIAAVDGPSLQETNAQEMLEIGQLQAEWGDRDAALKSMLEARRRCRAVVKQRDWPAVEFLCTIAKEQLKLKDRAAVEKSFQEAMRFANSLEPDRRQIALRNIIEARADIGDFTTALKIVPSIDDLVERIDCLGQIAISSDKIPISELERILQLIDSTKNLPHEIEDGIDLPKFSAADRSISILMSMATREAKGNDRTNARKSIQRAEAISRTVDVSPWVMSGIIDTLVRMGDIAEATRLDETIKDDNCDYRSSILNGIAIAHEERGDWAAALKVRQSVLLAAEGKSDKIFASMSIAKVHIKAGNRDLALKMLYQALSVARSNEVRDKDSPREEFMKMSLGEEFFEESIAKSMAEARAFPEAILLARTIKRKQIQGHVLAWISGEQARSGDIRGALQTAGSIKPLEKGDYVRTHCLDQTSAFLGIISTQAGAGDLEGAFATFDRLKDGDLRYAALLGMAEAYGKRNHH